MAFARYLAAAVCAVVAFPALLGAQYKEPPPPAAYALEGVTVVGLDGRRLEGATVVVRDGSIESIGTDIEAPGDAERLEGDSLFVYPGLIDADGEVEYEFPEREIDRSQIAAWNPPRHVQGFMPHRRVVDHLQATGADLEDQRQAGVVAAGVHPDGPLVPGRGTVVMMRPNAGTPGDLVLRPALGPILSFEGASGRVYPRALFAVIAFYRQTFEDARHLAAHRQAFERARAGVKPPPYDPDLAVFQEAMNGGQLYFRADLARDIQRVLELSRTYGFQPLIVGGEEAWKVADELKAQDVPVLVSLEFPEPERWEPEESEAEEEDQPPGDGRAGRADQEASQERELSADARREKERIENAYANAGRLADAGVRFALTSGGGEAELLAGARKAIEYGLSEEAALLALTVTPETLLGLEPISRVERGRNANFIVADGPLFAEDTKVRYTFVEGVLERGDAGAGKKAAGEEPTVDVTGTWELTTRSPNGTRRAEVVFEQSGSTLEGSYTSSFGQTAIRNGVVSGSTVSFSIRVELGDNRVTVEFAGDVEEDEIEGDGDSNFGDFEWNAKRVSGPEGGMRQ